MVKKLQNDLGVIQQRYDKVVKHAEEKIDLYVVKSYLYQ